VLIALPLDTAFALLDVRYAKWRSFGLAGGLPRQIALARSQLPAADKVFTAYLGRRQP